MRLDMSFAPHRARPSVASIALVLCSAAALAGMAYSYRGLALERTAAETRLQTLERRAGQRTPTGESPNASADTIDELRRAAAVVTKLELPWDMLFAELEAAAGADVTLLALEPDPANRLLQVRGEAKDFDVLAAYIARLEARDALADVWLVSHEAKAAGAKKRLVFTLAAKWLWNR